jgi:hypothetical protein
MCEEYATSPDSILHQLWSGNVSVRRSHWLQAIKRPRVGCYLDDKELGLLLREEGLRAVFDPKLRADHWYARSLRGLVERAEMSVVAQAQLRTLHRDVMGPLPAAPPPRPALRGLLRAARSSQGWFVVKWGLITLAVSAAALRISALEDKATEALSWLARARTERTLPTPLAEALRSGQCAGHSS